MQKFKKPFSFLFICLLLVVFQSCKKETLIVPPVSLNYFPTEPGTWVSYSVDSIFHAENDNLNDDSVYYFHCEIKEEIDSSFVDGSGKTVQVVNRYYRKDASNDWSIINVWTQYLTPYAAYRIENNIPLHKLTFPINEDISWNGNDANSEDEEIYSYEYFHEQGSYGGMSFDSTLSVIQMDEDNYIERIYKNEIYATGVGLVYKQQDVLGKINGIIVNGFEIRTTVIDFGRDY